MHLVRRLPLLLLAGGLLGCHQGGPQWDLMERELRIQEDRIFQLEDMVQDYQSQLSDCRCPQCQGGAPAHVGPVLAQPVETQESLPSRLRTAPPRDEADDGPTVPLIPPDVDPGVPLDPGSQSPPAAAPEADPLALDRDAIQELVLQCEQIGRLPSGGPGLRIELAPRTGGGELVRTDAQVSLLMVDPNRSGPAAQLSRWDFAPADVADAWKAGARRTMRFDVPWRGAPSGPDPLRLHARLQLEDGRKLLTEISLETETAQTPPLQRRSVLVGPDRTAGNWDLKEMAAPEGATPPKTAPPALLPDQEAGAVRQASGVREPAAARQVDPAAARQVDPAAAKQMDTAEASGPPPPARRAERIRPRWSPDR